MCESSFGADGDDGVYRYTVASSEPATAWPTVFHVSADGTVDEVWRPVEPVALAAGKATELSWPAANQWVFIRVLGTPRIAAVSRIRQQFSAQPRGGFPKLDGWCCTAYGAAG